MAYVPDNNSNVHIPGAAETYICSPYSAVDHASILQLCLGLNISNRIMMAAVVVVDIVIVPT